MTANIFGTKLSAKALDTITTFAIESELRVSSGGRQRRHLHFDDGTIAHRSARSTLEMLVDRGYLEWCIKKNQSAVRLTPKGIAFLNS